MIRKSENSVSWKAGILAIIVHVLLLGAILISVNWKSAHPSLNVTEVELWDKLPGQSAPKPPAIKVQEPKPEPKPEPKVEEPKPEPKVEEPKPEPRPEPKPEPKVEEPKVDIELEKKKEALKEKEKLLAEKKLEEKRKKEEEKKKLLAAMRDEDLEDKAAAKKESDALKKLQEEALNDEKGESSKQASAANANLINEFKARIQAKIRRNVNNSACTDGNPEVRFEIGLMPTGQLSGSPQLTKSSGNSACDEAVERAIIASEPLPLPDDPALFSSFRHLNLKFRPNE